jgi:hypothetical protein
MFVPFFLLLLLAAVVVFVVGVDWRLALGVLECSLEGFGCLGAFGVLGGLALVVCAGGVAAGGRPAAPAGKKGVGTREAG